MWIHQVCGIPGQGWCDGFTLLSSYRVDPLLLNDNIAPPLNCHHSITVLLTKCSFLHKNQRGFITSSVSHNCSMRSSNICCYCTLLFAASLNLFASFSFGKNNGVCVSPGGRFPPFSNEGKPPRRVNKGPKDLTFCRVFRKNTCCDVKQTHPALLSVRRLASTGEASQECLQLWELLECAICDPHVGTRRGIPLICESFCERIYQACSGAYFSVDAKTQVLAPCGVGDFVCGRASEYISNGTELCVVAGFSVMPRDDPEDISCYGGQASLDYIADSLKAPKAGVSREKQTPEILEELRDWWESMPLSNRISWAVGGMVLTAGLLLVRQRRSHSKRQKGKRTGRKLGTK